MKMLFYCWKLFPFCLDCWLLHSVQDRGEENKACHSVLIPPELWCYGILLEKLSWCPVGIVKLTNSEQKCDEWVWSLISNCLNFLCLKEEFCDKQQCPSETKNVFPNTSWLWFSVPITVLGILQHILNVVNHDCVMSLSKALFQTLTWW